jgi:transcription initiation factor IIF auxiliary subunit
MQFESMEQEPKANINVDDELAKLVDLEIDALLNSKVARVKNQKPAKIESDNLECGDEVAALTDDDLAFVKQTVQNLLPHKNAKRLLNVIATQLNTAQTVPENSSGGHGDGSVPSC